MNDEYERDACDALDALDADASVTTEYIADVEGERLDVFAARACGETRSYVQRLIEREKLSVNGGAKKSNYKLKRGDSVRVTIDPPEPGELAAEDIPIDIVYEDADIAVINKAKGMVVHPAPGNRTGTLVNAIMFRIKDLSGIGGEMRPGIVHRIDKLTSGLIVIAKNDFSHRALAGQIKEHTAARVYLALVDGNIKDDEGTVDAPIGRHPVDRKRMAVTRDGREAVTHFRVVWRGGDHTLVAAKLETGRTHQIRVHMAHIKHPVSGDTVYGAQRNRLGLDGQALHAGRLSLTHPRTGERMTFRAGLPDYFLSAIKRAGFDGELSIIENALERFV